MRNVIGYDTPSKAKLQEELKEQEQVQTNSPQSDISLNIDKIKIETIVRLNQLGDLITSAIFVNFTQEQKQQMLMDFAYYSKVSDSI